MTLVRQEYLEQKVCRPARHAVPSPQNWRGERRQYPGTISSTQEFSQENLGLAYENDEGQITILGSDRPYSHLQESRDFKAIVKNYLHSSEGQQFQEYLSQKGKKHIALGERYAAGDLEDRVVAAVLHNGDEGILVGNYNEGKDFTDRVAEFAVHYGLTAREAMEYVLSHEFTHVAGYLTEEGTEQLLAEYFQQRAGAAEDDKEQEKYERLAAVAEERAEEARGRGE